MKEYTGKQRTIYQIPNYHNSIWFINTTESNERAAKVYTNQTNGVCCNHPEAKGVLYKVHTFNKKKSRPEIFNPDFWYAKMYRENRLYNHEDYDAAAKELGYVNDGSMEYLLKEWTEYEPKILELLNKKGQYIDSVFLKNEFERELKKILPKEFIDCEVILDFLRFDKMGNEMDSSHEAWVFVRLFEGKIKDKFFGFEYNPVSEGIITWNNCD